MRALITSLSLMFLGCGGGADPTVQLTLSGAETALSDPAITDFVIKIQNVTNDGKILDTNKDGQPDTFEFPESCRPKPTPVQCGYTPTTTDPIEMAGIPLQFKYTVSVFFRDSAGATQYNGSVEFVNTNQKTPLVIPVVTGAP